MKPGDLAIVNSGRHIFRHGVVVSTHPDLGAHGFVTVNFIGPSGRLLKRNGSPDTPTNEAPPLDMLPVVYLNVWAGERGGCCAGG